MIQAIIPLIARAAAAASRAAPALSRMATAGARAAPVRSGLRAGLRDAGAAIGRAQPQIEAFESLSGSVASATHEMGLLTGMVYDAGKAFFTLPARIRDFSSAVIDAQHTLATYNGTMAAANMRLQGERFRRDLSLSMRTKASYGKLARSQTTVEDAILPYKAAGQNIINTTMTGLNTMSMMGIKAFEVAFPFMDQFLKNIGSPAGGDLSSWAAKTANEIARGDHSKRRMPVLGDPAAPPAGPKPIFGAEP